MRFHEKKFITTFLEFCPFGLQKWQNGLYAAHLQQSNHTNFAAIPLLPCVRDGWGRDGR